MTFSWKKHAKCLRDPSKGLTSVDCSANRAEMIAEGERVEREWCSSNRGIARLEAENARLREALKEIEQLLYCGTPHKYMRTCPSCIARAALSSVGQPQTHHKLDGVKP